MPQLFVSLKDQTANELSCPDLGTCFRQIEHYSINEEKFLTAPANNRPPTTAATIQSYTDASGQVWIAKGGVNGGRWYRPRDVLHASVYRNAAFTSSTTNLLFAFDTTIRDTYGLAPTFSVFNCPIAGYYRAHYQIGVSSTAANQYINCNIQATGVTSLAVTNSISPIVGAMIASLEATRYYAAGSNIQLLYYTSVASLAGIALSSISYGEFDYIGSGP
jgi:hypothetical protein